MMNIFSAAKKQITSSCHKHLIGIFDISSSILTVNAEVEKNNIRK